MDKLKVSGIELRIVHFEFTLPKGMADLNPVIDVGFVFGKDPKTLKANGVRIRWTIRIQEKTTTYLSYIAEDDYKIEAIKTMNSQNYVDLITASGKRAFADLNGKITSYGVKMDDKILTKEYLESQFEHFQKLLDKQD